jgi:hypothetical protein
MELRPKDHLVFNEANFAALYRVYAHNWRSIAATGRWNEGARDTLIRLAEDCEGMAKISENITPVIGARTQSG